MQIDRGAGAFQKRTSATHPTPRAKVVISWTMSYSDTLLVIAGYS